MPLVSVIIPCYNAKKYLDKCLNALELQTFNDFEVVIVDDCSSDGSYDYLRGLKNRFKFDLNVLKNEYNSGPAVTRNNGIKVAKGEFISFCDSDDWYDPNYLELMVKELKKQKADMVFCNYRKIFLSGKKIDCINIKSLPEHKIDVSDTLGFGVDSLCTIMIKKEIIYNTPIPDIRNGEDMAVIPLLIMQSKAFGVVETPIYNYYCVDNSLSRTVDYNVINSLELSFKYILDHCDWMYRDEIEFIGIKNVVYGVLLNYFKLPKINRSEFNRILNDFEKVFPNWFKNKYYVKLGIIKKIFVYLASKRCFFLLRIMAKLHTIYVKG